MGKDVEILNHAQTRLNLLYSWENFGYARLASVG